MKKTADKRVVSAPVAQRAQNLRRKIAIATAILLALAIAVVGLYLNSDRVKAISQEEAKKIAATYVPDSASYLAGETDDDGYEFKWFDTETGSKYEVELRGDGPVRRVESQRIGYRAAKAVSVTKETVREQFGVDFPEAVLDELVLDQADGGYEYYLRFTQGNFTGFAVYDADRGTLAKYKMKADSKILLTLDQHDVDYESVIEAKGYMNVASIEALARQQVYGAVITGLDLDEDDEQAVYEITLLKDGVEYELLLDAKTGDMVSVSRRSYAFSAYDELLLDDADTAATSGDPAAGETLTSTPFDSDDDDDDDNEETRATVIIQTTATEQYQNTHREQHGDDDDDDDDQATIIIQTRPQVTTAQPTATARPTTRQTSRATYGDDDDDHDDDDDDYDDEDEDDDDDIDD